MKRSNNRDSESLAVLILRSLNLDAAVMSAICISSPVIIVDFQIARHTAVRRI